ncbi:EF-hand domain-containing protein [Aestuariibius sp. 2305UL40-4]|uniref:EF-hand domain-containing protein n=1 Tax=Aestuariibius violaceus TaxID=3234132 RepID=UPI00345EEDFE
MKRLNFTAISALTLCLVGLGAVVANAQDDVDPTPPPSAEAQTMRADLRGDHGGNRMRGHRGGMRGGEMLRDIFDAADADGDGAVTQTEIDAYRSAQLAEVDASGDGALSIEEFDTLYRSFTRSRMVDAFQALDADGDGQIAPEEMDRSVSRFFERMDRDGDGTLTLQRPGRPAPQE